MKTQIQSLRLPLLALAICSLASFEATAQDLKALEEQAMRAAVSRVEPSVVRIQTIGGLEKVGQVRIGRGPTTGLIVSEDGLILSSAFNFVQKPASILVTLPGGQRAPAELVATDHSRMLVLLKVATDQELPVPVAAPESELNAGAWAIAVGRTFAGEDTNMSVGVISAMRRNFGKSIQTDAKISPSNYGGPLVDIRGRVLGILAPMSPKNSSEIAGVEWYDSGIGFAVPLESMLKVLPRLREGEDLYPGKLGVNLTRGDPYSIPAKLALVRSRSPALDAGLEAGDEIVEVDGREIATQMQFRLAMGPRYAGETVSLIVLRGEERIEKQVKLVQELEPYVPSVLGVLPVREKVSIAQENQEQAPEKPTEKDESFGVAIRFVYPGTGAEEAGLLPGDRIVAIDDQPTNTLAAVRRRMATHAPGDEVPLQVYRDGEKIEINVTASRVPSEIVAELPPDESSSKPIDGERPTVGASEIQLTEFKNLAFLYVPESYDPSRKYGLVVWLHAAGGVDEDELLNRWKVHCQQRDLILVAPRSADLTKWERTETEYIQKVIWQVLSTYAIDRNRIVAHGYQTGGAMAYQIALGNVRRFAGVAVVEAPLSPAINVPSTSPSRRLMVYSAQADQSRFARRISGGLKRINEAQYPLTTHSLGAKSRYLEPEEVAELARWIDSLDVL